MGKIAEMFTPKKIIFNALKSKLEGTGIIKLVLVFNVQTDKYNIMLSKEDNSSMKLELAENEMSMLKKMFIKKIENKYYEESNKEIQSIILQLCFLTDDIKVFIQDIEGKVELFNY